MKILYLTEQLTNGGTAKHLSELLPLLEAEGHDTVVLSFGDLGRYGKSIQKSGVRVVQSTSILGFIKILINEKFDIVHSYLYAAHVQDVLVATLFGQKYIKSTRNTGHWFTRKWTVRVRVALRTLFIRHHLVNSHTAAGYLVDEEGVKADRVDVIGNGMSDRLSASHLLGAKNKAFVIVSLSWLKSRKRVEKLINLMPSLVKKDNNIELKIIGSGPEREALEGLAAQLNVHQHCHFLGRLDEPYDHLALSDVMVSASLHEGMPNAVIEAQMMGVPCIIDGNTGGSQEIVEEGVNGYCYEDDDWEYIIQLLLDLNSDRDKLKAMQESAREYFLKEFSLASQLEKFLLYYERINSQ